MNWTRDRIQALLEQHDMTTGELADRLGASHNTVLKWERGLSSPSDQYRDELSELMEWDLGCSACGAQANVPMNREDATGWAAEANVSGEQCGDCGQSGQFEVIPCA